MRSEKKKEFHLLTNYFSIHEKESHVMYKLCITMKTSNISREIELRFIAAAAAAATTAAVTAASVVAATVCYFS